MGDHLAAFSRGESSFEVGTIGAQNNFVKGTWKTLTPEQVVDLTLNPNFGRVNGLRGQYNIAAMDASWGNNGWTQFFVNNGVK